MKIKKKIFFFFFIFFLNINYLKASEVNLDQKFIPLKDFIILKFEQFMSKNMKNILNEGWQMVVYQKIDYELKVDEQNKFFISISAFMDQQRYKAKKYYPKLSDCNEIRNKFFVNKIGYSFFRRNLNYSVNEENLTNAINENILNISILNDDQKEKIIKNMNIEIKIFHPNNQKNITCAGNILDGELK